MTASVSVSVWGLAFGLLAAGCSGGAGSALPACQDWQPLITTADGQLGCGAVPALYQLPLPPAGCAPGQALATDGKGGLSCFDPEIVGAAGVPLRLEALTQAVAAITQSAAQLRARGVNYSEPLYVGTTQALTTGRITLAGRSGILAAAGLCAAEFGATATMCTQFQLIRSVARGKLSPDDRIAPAWMFLPTGHNPGASTTEPKSGIADNCGGYTTQDDSIGWTGATVEWSPLDSGDVVFRWHGGSEALCSTLRPIACCKGGTP